MLRSQKRSKPWLSALFVGVVCVAIGGPTLQSLFAQEQVTAQGLLTLTTFQSDGVAIPRRSGTNRFSIIIAGDGRYLLEISPLHESEDTIYQSYDGNDTYFVRYREAEVDINQNITSRTPIEKKVNPAYVSSGNYPYAPWEYQHRPHMIWLGLASGSFVNSLSNSMPLPWIAARWSLMSFGYRLESNLSPSPPFAPISLKFIRDESLDLKSENMEMERPELNSATSESWITKWERELKERKTTWTNGFLAGEVQGRDFVEVNGLSIPKVFTIRTFHPLWRSSRGKVKSEYIGVITNLGNTKMLSGFKPPLKSLVRVEDSRFRFRDEKRSLNGINYPLTAVDGWSPVDSEIRQQEFKADISSPEFSQRFHSKTPFRRFSVLGVLIALLIVASVVLVRSFRAKQDSGK